MDENAYGKKKPCYQVGLVLVYNRPMIRCNSTTKGYVFDHLRSGVVYISESIRVYVGPMSVCQTITFESLDVGS